MHVTLLKKLILTLLVVISGSINMSCIYGGDQLPLHAAAEQLPEPGDAGDDEEVGQSGDAGEDMAVRTPGVPDPMLRVSSAVSASGSDMIIRIFFLTPLRPPSV
jgi:hypothetical protein